MVLQWYLFQLRLNCTSGANISCLPALPIVCVITVSCHKHGNNSRNISFPESVITLFACPHSLCHGGLTARMGRWCGKECFKSLPCRSDKLVCMIMLWYAFLKMYLNSETQTQHKSGAFIAPIMLSHTSVRSSMELSRPFISCVPVRVEIHQTILRTVSG